MIEETFTQKIIGMDVMKMFDIIRNKINFVDEIQGAKFIFILDGETGKYVLPNGDYGYMKDEIGVYYKAIMEDKSSVTIIVDTDNNCLKFKFKTPIDKLVGLKEAMLNYIDYDYGKDYNEKYGEV